MESILSSGQFTHAEIRRLNYCRLFFKPKRFQISRLLQVPSWILKNSRGTCLSARRSISHGIHINQQRQLAPEWKLWRKANRLWSNDTGKLYQPLGPWLHPIKSQQQQHHACQSHQCLWVCDNNTYLQCRLVNSSDDGLCRGTGTSCSWHDILPDDSLP